MNGDLSKEIQRVSDIRERLVQQAKDTRPTAKFHVDLVRSSQAIERAQKAKQNEDAAEVEAAIKSLRDIDDLPA